MDLQECPQKCPNSFPSLASQPSSSLPYAPLYGHSFAPQLLNSASLPFWVGCAADAQPTEAETAVWNQVNAVLEEAQTILAELQSYTGAGQEIREV